MNQTAPGGCPTPMKIAIWRKWKYLPAREKRVLASAFLTGALCGVLLSLPFNPNVWELRERHLERQEERERLAPYIDAAENEPQTYETAQVGKPVVWRVCHPAKGLSYLNGRPSQPLEWTNEALVPWTAARNCDATVAVVEGRSSRGVLLRYVGQW